MRAPLIGLLTVVVLCLSLVVTARAQSVTVEPAEGNQEATFLFRGSDFTPGDTIAMRFTSPAGDAYMLLDQEGRELFLTVAEDGTFSIEIVPVELFVGAPAGLWRAEFCPATGDFCLAGTFTIRVE
jgi:hypothetical protein